MYKTQPKENDTLPFHFDRINNSYKVTIRHFSNPKLITKKGATGCIKQARSTSLLNGYALINDLNRC